MTGRAQEQQLFGLGMLASTIRWIEELLNTLNGVNLMIGAGIAVVDLLTGGALAHTLPWVVFVWAVSQAVGIEVQLLGSFARARQAQRLGTHGAMWGWLLLGMVLLATTILASYVYALVRVQGVTTQSALAELGIGNFAFLGLRACLAAGLVALSGWTRYVGHTKALDTAGERAKLEHEMVLAPLRARVRAQKLKSLGVATRGAIAGFTGRDDDDGATGTDFPDRQEAPDDADQGGTVVTLARARKGRNGKRRKTEAEIKDIVYKLLDKQPTMPLNEIAHRGHVGIGSASIYKHEWEAEHGVERDGRGRLKRARTA
jgi:hypothetical protein